MMQFDQNVQDDIGMVPGSHLIEAADPVDPTTFLPQLDSKGKGMLDINGNAVKQVRHRLFFISISCEASLLFT
jgi:hypothetical protein